MPSKYLYAKDLGARLAFVLLGLALLFACTDNTGRDKQLLAKDRDAIARLGEINTALSQTQQITPENFAALVRLREKYPAAPEIAMTYKAALVAREDWETLEKLLVASGGPQDRADQLMLAKVRIKLGKYADSLEILKRIGPADASDLDYHSLCANAYANLGDNGPAAAELDGVWQPIIEKRRLDDMNLRGMIYFREKNYEKAIETFKSVLQFSPSDTVAANMLSRVYSASGDAKTAEVFRQTSEKAHEDNNIDELKKIQFASLAAKIKAAWDQKQYDEVISLGEQMLPLADAQNRPAVEKYIDAARTAAGTK